MAEKFTFEKHQENMRKILTPPPVVQPDIKTQLLKKVRARGIQPTRPRTPGTLPTPPEIPKI